MDLGSTKVTTSLSTQPREYQNHHFRSYHTRHLSIPHQVSTLFPQPLINLHTLPQLPFHTVTTAPLDLTPVPRPPHPHHPDQAPDPNHSRDQLPRRAHVRHAPDRIPTNRELDPEHQLHAHGERNGRAPHDVRARSAARQLRPAQRYGRRERGFRDPLVGRVAQGRFEHERVGEPAVFAQGSDVSGEGDQDRNKAEGALGVQGGEPLSEVRWGGQPW